MNHAATAVFRLFALVWLALGMSVPVSAWTAHSAAHAGAQVGLDEHHHHHQDGGISVHHHGHEDVPDGGHDHMPSILLGAVDLPAALIVLQAPMIARPSFIILPSDGMERIASDGLRRPPRID